MLTMATMQEIRELGSKGFTLFPAWIEMNRRYTKGDYSMRSLIRPVSVETCDHPNDVEPELYTSHGNFELDGYGKSWRLWYACGQESLTASRNGNAFHGTKTNSQRLTARTGRFFNAAM